MIHEAAPNPVQDLHWVMIQPVGTETPAELLVVVNWAVELKARLSVAGT
jgi:hypothetical protein